MKYCPNCGRTGVERMKFCPRCGQRLTGSHLGQDQSYVPKQEATKEDIAMDVRYEKQQRFEPLNKRTQLLFWILVISMVLGTIALFSDFAQAELLNRIIGGEVIAESEAIANDNRQAAIGFGQIVLGIASVVVFLMWIYRANRNLRSLRAAGLRFTPGWAVGYFFIPIMNLFRPYQVVSEIWKASDPKVDTTDDTSWKAVGTSPIAGCWWALFLISYFVGITASQLLITGIEPSDLLDATYAYMLLDGIDVACSLVMIFIVRRISQFQEAKNRLISSTCDKNIELSPHNANAYTRPGSYQG